MRYHELIGLIDDVFAKYRKEECSPDSKWTPYCYYKNLSDAKNDYSVYVGSKGLREDLESILTRLQEEEKFEFTEKQWEALGLTLEPVNTQHNDECYEKLYKDQWLYINPIKKLSTDSNEKLTRIARMESHKEKVCNINSLLSNDS